jgi:hypothetical protein
MSEATVTVGQFVVGFIAIAPNRLSSRLTHVASVKASE